MFSAFGARSAARPTLQLPLFGLSMNLSAQRSLRSLSRGPELFGLDQRVSAPLRFKSDRLLGCSVSGPRKQSGISQALQERQMLRARVRRKKLFAIQLK